MKNVSLRRKAVSNQQRKAFTLSELLVVVSIIGLIGGIIVPFLGPTLRDTRFTAAQMKLQASVQAGRGLLKLVQIPDRDGTEPRIPGADYSGTAVIVFEDGSIHFTFNNQAMKNTTGDYVESLSPKLEAYTDISGREPLQFSPSVMTGAFKFDTSAAATAEISPIGAPYAICFNKNGNVVAPSEYIYYDMDGDGLINPSTEQIPVVTSSVLVFDKGKYESRVGEYDPTVTQVLGGTTAQLFENDYARLQMFSQQSGTYFR